MKVNIRIKDIALKANVSTGTVDRVLHNRGNVNEKVKEKVLKIISEMKYEPNYIARALGSNKTYHLAALIPDHSFDSYWLAPKSGIEKAEKDLGKFGIQVHQYQFDPFDAKSFVKAAKEVTAANPDGILLSPIFYREVLPFFEAWRNENIPFVLFNTQIAEFDPLSYIGQDSYQSGYLAGKLIHYGAKQPSSVLIVHIDEEISNAAHLLKKEQGLRNFFLHNDLADRYPIVKAELNRADINSFRQKLNEVFESEPNIRSVFVTTSKAHEIAKHLEQRHLPDVNIVGYDLLPQNLYYLNKGTISFLINQNPRGQGYWGINQLVEHLVFKKEVAPVKFLPLDIITKENLNYYLDEDTN
ncbi:substrate-binding domain-containing protein [Mucilaginibacter daejeonensis]|uniref:substrate-binding domain-containing protein n=1 Tax=Mucilaginibacter daejeonensis TaxID=398049 RepID=UPI001D1733AF|nr:substrate-binding domain-containing protein [Mucilaginibacter daejeonensis]UEG54979.1 substrate-binding domain-containing protein [Mucilaginibacter daejeonensis]